MVARSTIHDFAHQLAETFSPQRIILFGSYAHGHPGPDSDVDLLVIMPFRGSPHRKATEIRLRVPSPFPLDLLVRTPQAVTQRLRWRDSFVMEIVREGKVLYEAAHR